MARLRRHGLGWAARIGSASAVVGLLLSGASSGAGAASTGVSSTSITLGATEPLTGIAAPGYDEIAPAMDAVFSWANAHGGIYGRKINFQYVDDGYNPANTATQTRKLVLQNGIFGTVGALGTPTQAAVQGYLNALRIPQTFVASGCNCWTSSRYPYTTGWQPPYTVDGKILGSYIKAHFAGQKVGYLYQNDEFGQDVVKGLDMQLPASSVVSRQTYDAATLSGPLTTQMSALQSAGAQVVVLATVPAATALSLLPAFILGYKPQFVVDAVGADPPTVGPLLSSFTKAGGGTSSQQAAAPSLLNGTISNAYLPAENNASNPWIQITKRLLQDYAPSVWAKYGLDGNTEYGVAVALSYIQALQSAGRNLTRQGLVNAIATAGRSWPTPGLVPLSYTQSNHFGYLGNQVVQLSSSAPPIVTPGGSFPGAVNMSPVYVTSPGAGPIKVYSGKAAVPWTKLRQTA